MIRTRSGLATLAAAVLASLILACASAAPPPGGAEDKMAPLLLRVTPDTNAVNVRNGVASFWFDETINDRGTGAQEVDAYFLVSPSDGSAKVSWHRSRIDVRPRNGFRPNTAYTITMLPGLADLRGNVMKEGSTLVFSTGPTIPTARIAGIVFDWPAERPAPHAYIEAVTPDSVIYLAQADSNGRFSIGPLTPGSYLVRAILDANNNRIADRNEGSDTLRVTAPSAMPIELLAAPRDTLPARLQSVAVTDSVTLRATFDRLLDPQQAVDGALFRLVAADSAVVPILWARSPRAEAEAARAATTTTADSARRADSLAGKPLPPRTTTPAAPPPPVQRSALPSARGAAASSASAEPAKPHLPAPFTVITLKLARPLAANATYRLRAAGLRGLSGRIEASERQFTTPRPAPPPAAKDSTSSAPAKRTPQ